MRRREGGQALVMVSLSLFAMCGLMGLAIDVGWSYYVHKMARAAADSAALAAVNEALLAIKGTAPPYDCTTTGITCSTPLIDCSSATGNLLTGCQYGYQNGFDIPGGGNGGHQKLMIQADAPPNACR
ncbi:MAG: hypothetical protein DMG59_20055, partial [Acidobacteria bacterium]